MGTDTYDRMYDELKAVGLEPLEAETWLELIFQISDIAKTDPEDVKGPILATIATGKMDYAALNSLQEKGVQLTGILSNLTGRGFPEVVTGGHVSSFLLKIALKKYVDNHKPGELEDLGDVEEINKADRLGKKFEAFFKKNNETSWPTDVSGIAEQSKRAHAELIYTKIGDKTTYRKADPVNHNPLEGSIHTPASFTEGMEAHISDPVNHPAHYTGFSNGAEVIDITENLSFNAGNAVKYLARAGRTDGNNKGAVLEDLEKARWYINREIQRLQEAPNEES